MKEEYLHITFFIKNRIKTESIQDILDEMAKDWIRYDECCIIVFTEHDPDEWLERLQKRIGKKKEMLIMELSDDKVGAGTIKPWIWEWLKTSR